VRAVGGYNAGCARPHRAPSPTVGGRARPARAAGRDGGVL